MKARSFDTILISTVFAILQFLSTSSVVFASPAGADSTKIMPIGDSITIGYTDHNSFRRALWHMLQDAGYVVDFVGSLNMNNGGPPPDPDFDLDHEGHSSWRADQFLPVIEGWANTYQPDIALIHLGSNDVFEGQSTASTIADLEGIIDRLRNANPDIKILLAQIMPSTFNADDIVALNAAIPGLAASKTTSQSPVIVVDHWTGFELELHSYDGVHPNDDGEQFMAQRWFDELVNWIDGPTLKWVDQSGGSDSNDGNSEATAYQSLQHAIDHSSSGSSGQRSVIKVKNGSYGSSGLFNQIGFATSILVDGLDYLTIASAPGHNPVIRVTAGSTVSLSLQNSNHVIIENLDSDQSVGRFDHVHVIDSQELTIRHSQFEGGNKGLSFISDISGVLIAGNNFLNLNNDNTAEVLSFITASYSDITIEDNYFSNNTRHIRLHEQFGKTISNATIRRNRMMSTSSQEGIRLIGVDALRMENNVVMNGQQQGIYIDSGCSNMELYHNTFYNNGYEELRSKVQSSDIAIKNNIFYANGTYAAIASDGALAGEDYNLIFNSGTATESSSQPALSSFGSHTLLADPQFVSTSSGGEDLHLQASSPALSAGTDVGVSSDLSGVSRPSPSGTSPDLGAYESGSDSGTPVPDIAVTPGSHDFGQVAVGESAVQSFVISNQGNAVLEVDALSITGADSSSFVIVSGAAPLVLPAGASENVSVSFQPAAGGAFVAALSITSNDPNENPFAVALSGQGEIPSSGPTLKWVDQSGGSDSNDGNSEATAYQSLQHAIDHSSSGNAGQHSVIKVKNGSYGSSGLFNQIGFATSILVDGLDYLTIASAPGHNPVIRVTAGNTVSLSLQNSNHVIIENLDSDQSVGRFDHVHVIDSQELTVRHSQFEGGNKGLSFISDISGVLIAGNNFLNLNNDNTAEVLSFITASYSDITIEDNYFSNNTRHIRLHEQFGKTISNATIRRNRMMSTSSQEGIRLIGVDALRMENNVVMNGQQQGIYIDSGCSNMELYHNTFYNNGYEELRSKVQSSDIAIKNNIFYANGTYAAIASDGALAGEDYNLIFNSGTATESSSQPALSSFGSHTLLADPQFVSTNSGSEDLHLQASSPALSAGTDVGVSSDLSGVSRPSPSGTSPDLGAYESGSDSGTPVPDIAVTPGSHDFGQVPVGESAAQSFVISNHGNAVLEVDALSITGADASSFVIVSGAAPLVLPAGASENVSVSFQPAAGGAFVAALSITSNDPNENPFAVALSGQGEIPSSGPTLKWVDQSGGSDSNDGNSEATAYQSLQHAIDHSSSGNAGQHSVIKVKNGSYGSSGLFNQIGFATSILVDGLDYLTIASAPGHNPVIRVTAGNTVSLSLQNSNHVIIENLDSDQSVGRFDHVHVIDSQELTVRHSQFEGGNKGLSFISDISGVLIAGNNFLNLNNDNTAEVLSFITASYSDITIEDNYFSNNTRHIRLHEQFGKTISNATIRRNRMMSTSSQEGIRLIGVDALRMENNVVMNGQQQGIYIDSGCSNMELYHNTFYNNGYEELRSKVQSSDIAIKNNIFYANGTYAAIASDGALAGEDYNLIFNSGTATESSSQPALSSFGSHTLLADPQFVSTNSGSEDLHLQASSPALSAGTDVGVSSDLSGVSRPSPSGTSPDLGAYENGSDSGTPLPDIAVTPGSHDFGQVPVGESAAQSFVISNHGNAVLEVDALSITGADASSFVIVSGAAPLVLPAGASENVSVSFQPASGGAFVAALSITSNDPDESKIDLSLTGTGTIVKIPDIAVDSTSFDFGQVPVSESAAQSFVISNQGNAVLKVDALTLSGADSNAFAIKHGTLPLAIAPDDSQRIGLIFAPTTGGVKSGLLKISSNDPDESKLDLSLTGTGTIVKIPDIAVDTTSFDFGQVPVGESAMQSFVISNQGSAVLKVGALAITGADSSAFAVKHGTLPLAIAPDDSQKVGLVFTPTTGGAKSGLLEISCNDPDETRLRIALSGEATEPAAFGFTLLADKKIEFKQHLVSEGRLHSNNEIKFEDGQPSVHTGNLTALGKINVKKYNTINGDLTAGDEISLDHDVTVNGTTNQYQRVDWVQIESLWFSDGHDNVSVEQYQSRKIAPAAYHDVKVDKNGTLHLRHDGSGGDYFFHKLEIKENASLVIDVSQGPVTVNVTDKLTFDKMTEVTITPNGDDGSHLVTFNCMNDVVVGDGAKVAGSILAPDKKVELKKYVAFKGSIVAKDILIKEYVTLLQHFSDSNLSKPVLPQDDSETEITGADEIREFALEQNYPNPFNPVTTIRFALPHSGEVSIRIFNNNGQMIKTLLAKSLAAGRYEVKWDGTDVYGQQVASGIYHYRMRAGDFIRVKKMSLIR